jgi:hypothetical protein
MMMRRVRHGDIYGGRKEVTCEDGEKESQSLLAPRFEMSLKYCTTCRSDVRTESGENV